MTEATERDQRKVPRGRRKTDVDLMTVAKSHERDRKLWLGGYVFLLGVVAFAFFRVDAADDRSNDAIERAEHAIEAAHDAIIAVNQEAVERDYNQCQSANEARSGIRTFIVTLFNDDDGLPNSDYVERIIELSEKSFAPLECPPQPASLIE